jgi:CYTH domain-containing protein
MTTPTTEANTFAIELLAQNIEKRRLLGRFDSFPFAVDLYWGQVT